MGHYFFVFQLAAIAICVGSFAQPLPLAPRAVSINPSDCTMCHMKKTHVFVPGVKRPFLEHKGFSLKHGAQEISCHSCHDANHGEKLRTSSEYPATYANSSPVCQQCHSSEYKDWSNGLHGRRTGGWDSSKAGRTQLHCIDCHSPHSVTFKPMEASAPPAKPHGAAKTVAHALPPQPSQDLPLNLPLRSIETAAVRVREFPCSKCHQNFKSGGVILKKEHTAIKMQHMEKGQNCVLCHSNSKPDMLHLLDGTAIAYAKTAELCGQCHGKVLHRWKLGFHGRQQIDAEGKKTRLSCGECHNAHSPKFELMKASARPMRPSERNLKHE